MGLGLDPAVRRDLIAGLLTGQRSGGGFGVPHYAKWRGAHWRLVSLVELGVAPGHPTAVQAANAVLSMWAGRRRLASVPIIAGRARRCASQEGNAVAVACRLGLGGDERVATLARHLSYGSGPMAAGTATAGRKRAGRASMKLCRRLWGLHEYATATGDSACADAAVRAAELLLDHRVYRRLATGEPISPAVVVPRWPPYWHYDILQAMIVLTRAGHGNDPRMSDARRLLMAQRQPDGRWRAGKPWWRPPGSTGSNVEAVDWGDAMHDIVTNNALAVGCQLKRHQHPEA